MKNNVKSLIKIIKELGFILDKQQKKKFFLVMFIILLGSAFELIGVSAILPFIQVLTTPDVLKENPLISPILNILHIQNSNDLLILTGIGLMLIYILKNVYILYSNYVQYDYSARIQKELSIKMLRSYMRRPYTYFLTTNSSEMMRGCNEDVTGIYDILSAFFVVISETVNMIVIGIFLIYIEPIISLTVIFLMLLVMLGIVLFFKPLMKRMGKKNVRAKQQRYKILTQTFGSVKELFVMQRQGLFIKDYEEASEHVRITQKNHGFATNAPDRIIEGTCVSGLIGVVTFRLMLGVNMDAFIPKLGVFAMAAFKILPSVGKLSSRMTTIVYNLPMLENVYRITHEAKLYESKWEIEGEDKDSVFEKKDSLLFKQKLSVRHISWQYENQAHPVLADVSIDINKGQAVAFIGASGAGKTTLSDVILGLLHPQKGGVFVDGTDICSVPALWSKIVGYVPQSVFLLDDTIRENIAFGLDTVDEAEIWRALEQAQLKEFVQNLPEELDTIVGERGVKFSGGQRQRVAIARALFQKPEILVLDEATAALDTETEQAVMEAIDALQGKITMIIVAHRLTTIKNCDVIYEIVNGYAVERKKEDVLRDIWKG